MITSVFQYTYNVCIFPNKTSVYFWHASQCSINGIILYKVFWDWFLLFKIIFEISLFWCVYFVHFSTYRPSFIHSNTDTHLDYFQILAISTNVSMNIPKYTCCMYVVQALYMDTPVYECTYIWCNRFSKVSTHKWNGWIIESAHLQLY